MIIDKLQTQGFFAENVVHFFFFFFLPGNANGSVSQLFKSELYSHLAIEYSLWSMASNRSHF